MVDEPANPRPVQVFLDTKSFIGPVEPQEFRGGNRDFFKDNDRGFAVHKAKIRARLNGISRAMRERNDPAGFVRVQMRENALGKSYRPLGSLFTQRHGFALVGAGRIGEMYFQATPGALDRLDELVEQKAELIPRLALNKKTEELEPRVSGYRSEVGAIDEIVLHDGSDRISFSAREAVEWMAQPNIIGGYLVELFRPNAHVASHEISTLVERLRVAFSNLPSGVRLRPFVQYDGSDHFGVSSLVFSVELLGDKRIQDIRLPFDERPIAVRDSALVSAPSRADGSLDLQPEHHQAFLELVSEQALIRSVDLPPFVEAAPAATSTIVASPTVSTPIAARSYPTVGIIDGGVAATPELIPWCAGDAGLVAVADRDESHGTFIAGLLVAGSALNPHLAGRLEPEGCKFYDLDIFPRRELRQRYFGGDIEYFFDLLDEKIKLAKRDHRVRVFNFSFGLRVASSQFGYTAVASRLDRIARINDIILIVSAGNLRAGETRPAWSSRPNEVVAMLAAFGSGAQRITPPAEHLLGLTVGAINPLGIAGCEPFLPTSYTRRGPGIGGARKPDLAHFGGVEANTASSNRTGLASLSATGQCVENCGTSFAAPGVAATVATLDHRLEHAQPRELLLALPIHRAKRGSALEHSALRHISREFVGFGLAPICDEILADDPYAITLVFSESLLERQKLEFPFAWPAGLVSDTGSCRGRVDLTLAYTPPIDADHKDEAQRVQLEAHLSQEVVDLESQEVGWESRLTQDGAGVPQGMNKTERYLLTTGLKWSPAKRYFAKMPNGRGKSSNWKLSLDALVRAGASYPVEGVPFALIMTISDPKRSAPIHDAVRNSLQAQGLNIADITVAHRIRPRRS